MTIRRGRSYRLRIAMGVATAMLIAGCGSSPEAGPKPVSKVQAVTTAPTSVRSSPGQGSFGQVGGWIAYGGEDGIWAVDPARPQRRIWLSGAGREPVAWSSDGTKLLIRPTSRGRIEGLYVLEADATERRLTAGGDPTGGSFSPDGSEIVYADGVGERTAIYAQQLGGGVPRLILRSTRRVSFRDGHTALAFVYQPALSPDGMRIAYFDGMSDHSHNLWVASADGSERRMVLDKELSAVDHIRALTWAPNGEWLAFVTDKSIYLVRPDGTGLRRVASPGVSVSAPGVQWSPDSSRIAYLRIGPTCISMTGKDEDSTCESTLSIANVDGSDEQVIEGIRTPPNSAIAWNPIG